MTPSLDQIVHMCFKFSLFPRPSLRFRKFLPNFSFLIYFIHFSINFLIHQKNHYTYICVSTFLNAFFVKQSPPQHSRPIPPFPPQMGALREGLPSGPTRPRQLGARRGPVPGLDDRERLRERHPHRPARVTTPRHMRSRARSRHLREYCDATVTWSTWLPWRP